MEQYALYLMLKDVINKLGYNYKISFNDYDINSDDVIGILFKSGNNPKYRELSTGKYYGYANRVQILIQSGYSKDSLFKLLNTISDIRNVLTSDINNIEYRIDSLKYIDNTIVDNSDNSYSTGDDVVVGITSTHMIGDVDFKLKDGQNRSVYSLNLMINYYIKLGGN